MWATQMIDGLAKELAKGGEVPFTSFGKTGGLQATLNDDARGMILTEGTSHRGAKFFIVDWLTDKGAEARRSKPDELVGVE